MITQIDLTNQLTSAVVVFSLLVIALALVILAFGKLERQAKPDKKKHGPNK